jgi:hypothetical protein
MSEEQKKKLSEANTGQKRSADFGKRISEANTGKTRTAEQKENISKALKKYWATIPE